MFFSPDCLLIRREPGNRCRHAPFPIHYYMRVPTQEVAL